MYHALKSVGWTKWSWYRRKRWNIFDFQDIIIKKMGIYIYIFLIPLIFINSKEVYIRSRVAHTRVDSYSIPYPLLLPSAYWFICSVNSLFRDHECSANVLNVQLNLV